MDNQNILTKTTWKKLADLISVHPKGALPHSHISDSLRSYVFERDEGLCIYCKSDAYIQCDHVIPVSHGGPAIRENIVLACQSCNMIKTNSFDISFLTIAFNHLLYVGESINWIDKIFSNSEEEEEAYEEIDETIESECLMCNQIFTDYEIEDFCCYNCEYNFEQEFDSFEIRI